MLGYVYRKPKAVFHRFSSGSNNWYVLSMEHIQSDITWHQSTWRYLWPI